MNNTKRPQIAQPSLRAAETSLKAGKHSREKVSSARGTSQSMQSSMKQMHTLSALISTPEISWAGTVPWLSRLLEARERDFRGSAFLNNQLAAFFNWPSKKVKGDQFNHFPQLLKQLTEEAGNVYRARLASPREPWSRCILRHKKGKTA